MDICSDEETPSYYVSRIGVSVGTVLKKKLTLGITSVFKTSFEVIRPRVEAGEGIWRRGESSSLVRSERRRRLKLYL